MIFTATNQASRPIATAVRRITGNFHGANGPHVLLLPVCRAHHTASGVADDEPDALRP